MAAFGNSKEASTIAAAGKTFFFLYLQLEGNMH
jgi:hypothetical protein